MKFRINSVFLMLTMFIQANVANASSEKSLEYFQNGVAYFEKVIEAYEKMSENLDVITEEQKIALAEAKLITTNIRESIGAFRAIVHELIENKDNLDALKNLKELKEQSKELKETIKADFKQLWSLKSNLTPLVKPLLVERMGIWLRKTQKTIEIVGETFFEEAEEEA